MKEISEVSPNGLSLVDEIELHYFFRLFFTFNLL